MEPFNQGAANSGPGNAGWRGLHIRIMTRCGAVLSIIWVAPKSICASGVTAISCRAMCHMQRRGC